MATCTCTKPVKVAPNPPEIRCLICGGIVPPPTRAALAAMEPEPPEPGLEAALETIKKAGYYDVTEEYNSANGTCFYYAFVHPHFDGAVECPYKEDVIEMAEKLNAGKEQMRAAMQASGMPDLTDDEIEMLAQHW